MSALLGELFYWLLNMSVSASIAGAVVCLVSGLRRFPRRLIPVLWAVPLLRLWIPVGINSRYSLMSLVARFTGRTLTLSQGRVEVSMVNMVMAADSYFPVTYRTDPLERVFQTASVLWLVGAAALILAMAILYGATKGELRDARPLRDNIYISGKVTSPAVYGILRPRIILPGVYEGEALSYILLHEEAHIRRRDNLWRVIGMVTACVHWFNPLSWLFLKRFLASLELACDEAVLRRCGEGEKRAYAAALLRCAQGKSLYASAFGGARVRVRIDRILSYQKLSALSAAASALLAAAVGYVLLTNAA